MPTRGSSKGRANVGAAGNDATVAWLSKRTAIAAPVMVEGTLIPSMWAPNSLWMARAHALQVLFGALVREAEAP